MGMKTLLLIDNQDITREGMKTVAGRIGGFAAIKEAGSQSELTGLLVDNPNAVAVLDYTLFDMAVSCRVRESFMALPNRKVLAMNAVPIMMEDQMEVDCAYDGEQAVEMARNTEYDVVLLDVMLPKLDGFQVCQAIREFSNMPIIMLTAKGDDMDKILGLAAV